MASAPKPKLWIPSSMNDESKPLVCRICGERFARDTQLLRHVESCWARIENQAREAVAEHKAEFDAIPDPEWRDYNETLKAGGQDPEVQYNRGRRSNIRRARES